MKLSLTTLSCLLTCFSTVLATQPDQDRREIEEPPTSKQSFDRSIAPILSSYCLECHSGTEPKGSLDLSSRASALRGGDSGPAIDPDNPLASELWQRIASGDMPPKDKLPNDLKATLHDWLQSGASWGTDPIDRFQFTTTKRAGADWWALQPLTNPKHPHVNATGRVQNPIDSFALEKLEAAQLTLAPKADPRVLIRRLYFDLVGLPPSPEEVERFTQDPSEATYRSLVDRLLDSTHYGERWGRHWLDVARFGESDGFERNRPRKSLWHYRDWVIEAFNQDMPYDEFVRMQIAGDALHKDTPAGQVAVGFLVAGVHNTVVGRSEFMKRQARQDELEEILGAVGQTFLGLTINCARCHDHKFDPIRQEEYYRLASALAGVHHAEINARIPKMYRRFLATQDKIEKLSAEIATIETPLRARALARRATDEAHSNAPEPYARWEFDGNFNDSIGTLHGKSRRGARVEHGALVLDGRGYVETDLIPVALREKTLEAWVQLDHLDQHGGGVLTVQRRGGAVFDSIVFAERESGRWIAGSDNFTRTQPFKGPEEREDRTTTIHIAITYAANGTITGYRDGVPYGKSYRSEVHSYETETSTVAFGLRHAPWATNKMLQGRILRAQLYDRALSADEIALSMYAEPDFVPANELVALLSGTDLAHHQELAARRSELRQRERELDLESQFKLYTVESKEPHSTHFLPRGDVMNRGRELFPGGTAAVVGAPVDFKLAASASDERRREALAAWITTATNPLFARVIVNRLWHYHFGTGIVETPNDFGFNGSRPSHPKLIDWLASQLIAHEYRLKPLHRAIVLSAVYRQSTKFNTTAHKLDASNRLLWRRSPQRLEAEALRDTLLAVSGKLNTERGGPGFEDVTMADNNGTTYYEPIDKEDERFYRRTVYRFWPRGNRSALLDTFDCPDPSAAAPRRAVTTTPLQALSLLNNSFVLNLSEHFAARIQREVKNNEGAQVDRAYQLAYQRSPDETELRLATELVTQHGLSALARALFNSNEFLVVD